MARATRLTAHDLDGYGRSEVDDFLGEFYDQPTCGAPSRLSDCK